MRGIPLFVMLILIAGVARADERAPFSAAEVASWCEPYRTAVLTGDQIRLHVTATYESQVCYGAFLAIQQLITARIIGHSELPLLEVCGPPNGRLVDLIKIFLRYTDEHPERGHEMFTNIALESLWKAYPCSTQPPAKH